MDLEINKRSQNQVNQIAQQSQNSMANQQLRKSVNNVIQTSYKQQMNERVIDRQAAPST